MSNIQIQWISIISGFRIYIASGSDPIRFGIYRGFVKGSPVSNATLVGQSASTPSSTSLPFTSGVITAVAGQNLFFTTGEYMVLGFSSAGTTNIYFTSPTSNGVGIDILFSGPSNYVTSGFPTVLTSAQISSSLTIKVCVPVAVTPPGTGVIPPAMKYAVCPPPVR